MSAAPLHGPTDERLAALCAHIGRQAADAGALIFRLPLAADLHDAFARETARAIGEMLDEAGPIAPADRERFEQIAVVAFGRRMARHAAMAGAGGAA